MLKYATISYFLTMIFFMTCLLHSQNQPESLPAKGYYIVDTISFSSSDFTITMVLENIPENDSRVTNIKAHIDEATRQSETYDEPGEHDFQPYKGDIQANNTLTLNAYNLLVIGNIKTTWLNAVNYDQLGYDEGGSLFVTGSVSCDYFSNHFGKLVVIGGVLRTNKILNNAFQGAALIVQEDIVTKHYNGADI